jgi:hypothetical protein
VVLAVSGCSGGSAGTPNGGGATSASPSPSVVSVGRLAAAFHRPGSPDLGEGWTQDDPVKIPGLLDICRAPGSPEHPVPGRPAAEVLSLTRPLGENTVDHVHQVAFAYPDPAAAEAAMQTLRGYAECPATTEVPRTPTDGGGYVPRHGITVAVRDETLGGWSGFMATRATVYHEPTEPAAVEDRVLVLRRDNAILVIGLVAFRAGATSAPQVWEPQWRGYVEPLLTQVDAPSPGETP